MISAYENNMTLLRERYPLVARQLEDTVADSERSVITNPRGCKVFQVTIDGRTINLTSSYDPVREAERQVSDFVEEPPQLVFILGEAGFYHVEAALRRVSENTKVLVVSCSPSRLKTVFEHRDFEHILTDERLLIALSPDIETLKRIIDSLVNADLYTIPTFTVISHPVEGTFQESFFLDMKNFIHSIYTTSLANMSTTRKFEHWWSNNFLCNIPFMLTGVHVHHLKDTWVKRPVVIVGAGPSLRKNIQMLKRIKGHAIIICVDTAFRILERNGIKPDLVVTLDGSPMNAEHMDGCDFKEIPLLMDVYSHRDVSKDHTGSKVIVSSVESHDDWWRKVYGQAYSPSRLPLGGSVATAAFSFAHLIGADPIVVVGVDLSYPNGECYAPGALHDNRHVSDFKGKREMYEVPDIYGKTVYTTFDYLYYLRWFQQHTREIDRKCINATEGGALRAGFEIKTLKDTIDEYLTTELPVGEWVSLLAKSCIDESVVETVLSNLKRSRRELKAAVHFLRAQVLKLDEYVRELEVRDFRGLTGLTNYLADVNQRLAKLSFAMSFLDSHSFNAIYTDIKLMESIRREQGEYTEVERAILLARQSINLTASLLEVAIDSILMHDDGLETYKSVFKVK